MRGFREAKSTLENLPFRNGWQAKFRFGADLSKCTKPDFDGWTNPITHNLHLEPQSIQRVIFNVSGKARPLEQWENDIREIINLLNQNYTAMIECYLQPVIGGSAQKSRVRASKNHSVIVSAIHNIVGNEIGHKIKIRAILLLPEYDFSDLIRHLTEVGAQKAHDHMFNFYR